MYDLLSRVDQTLWLNYLALNNVSIAAKLAETSSMHRDGGYLWFIPFVVLVSQYFFHPRFLFNLLLAQVVIDRHPVKFFVHKRPHVDFFLSVVSLCSILDVLVHACTA